MKQVSIDQVKDDLTRYLQFAEEEAVIITRDGKPVGLLIGLEDSEDWWEALLLQNSRFQAEVAEARSSLRDGKGMSLEQLQQQYEA